MDQYVTPFSRRSLGAIVICCTLLFSVVAPLYASEGSAQLQNAVQAAIRILQDPSLKSASRRAERREQLRQVIYTEFDFHAISRGAIGHKWRKFSADQKARFIPLFKQLLENTYLNTVERYQGNDVKFMKEVQKSANSIRTDSVVQSGGTEFEVSYRLHRVNGQRWKVFDVIIEGISVVSNYRAQFKQMLRRGSPAEIEKMLTKLESTLH